MNLDQKTFGHLFSLVRIIYQALTEKALLFKSEVRGPRKNVISDLGYQIDDKITTLGENKSPNVFNTLIGQFMERRTSYKSMPRVGGTLLRGLQGHL